MAELPVWGIHVTTASIRGVKLARTASGLAVVAHDRFDFAEDIDDVASLDRHNALLHGLHVFAKRHDFSKTRVIVSVDGLTAFNRWVETPIVKGESMSRLLEYEAQQQIPFSLDGVHWDHKVIEIDENRNVAQVMLFAVRREIVEERQRRLEKVRFPFDDIQIAPLALFNYAAREGLAKGGVIIVSVDYDRTDLVVAQDRRVWFRTLPTGVFGLIEAIREEVEPRHRPAVRIARGEEEAADPAAFDRVRAAYAERLTAELSRMIDYYRGALRDVTFERILLLPGNAIVPPLGRLLSESTGLEVFGVKAFRRFEMDEAIVTPDFDGGVGPYAHAAGLALQGLDEAEVAVKLYPGSLERDLGSRKGIYVLAVLLAFVVVGLMWWKSNQSVSALEAEDEKVKALMVKSETQRQAYEKASRETTIRDEARPYLELGRDRGVPIAASEAFLDVLTAANSGRAADDRCFLVEFKTLPGDIVDGRETMRRVRFTLGTLGEGTTALDRMERRVLSVLDGKPEWSKREELRRYRAGRLSDAEGGAAQDGILRRVFQMVEFKMDFEEGAGR